jgi:CheY-like chemotaxis protein
MDSTSKLVLVVDDNESARKIISKIVQSLGYRTETAENGQKAVQVLGRITVDCVLMDLDMPVLDGYSASEFIRTKLKLTQKDLPIFAITAMTDQDLPTACEEFGMNGFANKPVSKDQLFALLVDAGVNPN